MRNIVHAPAALEKPLDMPLFGPVFPCNGLSVAMEVQIQNEGMATGGRRLSSEWKWVLQTIGVSATRVISGEVQMGKEEDADVNLTAT